MLADTNASQNLLFAVLDHTGEGKSDERIAPPAGISYGPNSWGLNQQKDLFQRVYQGGVSILEVLEGFERLLASEKAVKAELAKKTMAQLHKEYQPMRTLSTMRKAEMVEYAFNDLVHQFCWCTVTEGSMLSITGFGRDYEPERRVMAKLTQETLDRFVIARRERFAAAVERRKQAIAGIEDPKTLEDFKLRIKVRGAESLSDEQRVRYDELVAAAIREEREARPAQGLTSSVGQSQPSVAVQAAEGDGCAQEAQAPSRLVEFHESVHTKKKTKIFVVKLLVRVERASYEKLLAHAKSLGGYYSSYARDGAIPGFTFADEVKARTFMTSIDPAVTPGCSDVNQAEDRTAEAKSVNELPCVRPSSPELDCNEPVYASPGVAIVGPGDKLAQAAKRLRDVAQAALDAPRLTNTHRRVMHAEYAEKQARRDVALANTMGNLAIAINDGRAQHLKDLRDKVQVELLDNIYRSAVAHYVRDPQAEDRIDMQMRLAPIVQARWPAPMMYPMQASSVVVELRKIRGQIRLAAAVEAKYLLKASDAPQVVDQPLMLRLLEAFGERAKDVLPSSLLASHASVCRLERMGITCIEQLRAALREYVLFREDAAQADPVKVAERALVGAKVGIDFFPTPSALAKRMCEMAGLADLGDSVQEFRCLEPEAGNGMIADQIRDFGVEPVVCEISDSLSAILLAKGFPLVGRDFLEYAPEQPFSAVIMNPPFSGNRDIEHVRHARSMLAPGGHLVAIVGAGAMQRSGTVETAFREWLDSQHAEVEKLPEGTFTDRTLLATTGASAYLIHIRG